jgi:adenosine deaminase
VKEDDFFELTWAHPRKAASQSVVHVELFFDPQAHTGRGVPLPTVLGGDHRAVARAEHRLGVHAELILCFLRDLTAEHAMSTLAAATDLSREDLVQLQRNALEVARLAPFRRNAMLADLEAYAAL